MEPIQHRYDFTILYDVKDGNPNGDPDMDGMPRIDNETGQGMATDTSIKRRIRDYVLATRDNQPPDRIYIQRFASLNSLDEEAMQANGITPGDKSSVTKARKTDPHIDLTLRNYMCANYFDIRAFGAVMTGFSKNALSGGQVRGPVQLGFARSIDPISIQPVTITRNAVNTDRELVSNAQPMGVKYIIPYGLYRMEGAIDAKHAQRVTGFDTRDLNLLWEAIQGMFDLTRSAMSGRMAVRALIVFEHSNALGDAPSYRLQDSIRIRRRNDIKVARCFDDYEVTVDRSLIPGSIMVSDKTGSLRL